MGKEFPPKKWTCKRSDNVFPTLSYSNIYGWNINKVFPHPIFHRRRDDKREIDLLGDEGKLCNRKMGNPWKHNVFLISRNCKALRASTTASKAFPPECYQKLAQSRSVKDSNEKLCPQPSGNLFTACHKHFSPMNENEMKNFPITELWPRVGDDASSKFFVYSKRKVSWPGNFFRTSPHLRGQLFRAP